LKAVAKTLARQQIVAQGSRTLLKANQREGFDCPGCAWPDPKHTSSFEFCENGAKAITWESTAKRTDASFFAEHTVSELWTWTDHELEDAGRLTLPLRYDASRDRFEPIGWDAAFELIASGLNTLTSPDQAEFYTSGRASNEAVFFYQLFVRAYGTNNFPDC
jgi:anaerobic selenocysteine-containing dehydrogenase